MFTAKCRQSECHGLIGCMVDCCAVELFLCHSDEDCVFTHTDTLSANTLISVCLHSMLLSCSLIATWVIIFLFIPPPAVLYPSPIPLPSLSSVFIALPLSPYLFGFCQMIKALSAMAPLITDSHNYLTREKKFHSKNQILMDWAGGFFMSYSHAAICL